MPQGLDKTAKEKGEKCPLCKFPYCQPTTFNQLLDSIFMGTFPEEYGERTEKALKEAKKEKEKKKLRKELEKEIRKEIYATLSRDPQGWFDEDDYC